MEIIVNNHRNIEGVQEEFNRVYPYLRLEFFLHRHGLHQGNPKKDALKHDMLLKQFQKGKNEGKEFIIHEDMLVSELEEQFQKVFGISAQVFRKSGRSWIETTLTDDWTLKRQNDEGQELSYMAG
ncbi:MAG: hypothetical protein JST26_19510 [Bacteroidetes bacterium]|nr:hypothetical protein [Bacteroidota bacterium]